MMAVMDIVVGRVNLAGMGMRMGMKIRAHRPSPARSEAGGPLARAILVRAMEVVG